MISTGDTRRNVVGARIVLVEDDFDAHRSRGHSWEVCRPRRGDPARRFEYGNEILGEDQAFVVAANRRDRNLLAGERPKRFRSGTAVAPPTNALRLHPFELGEPVCALVNFWCSSEYSFRYRVELSATGRVLVSAVRRLIRSGAGLLGRDRQCLLANAITVATNSLTISSASTPTQPISKKRLRN